MPRRIVDASLVLAVFIVLLFAAAAAFGADPRPRTLASLASIDVVVQDGALVAWSGTGTTRHEGNPCKDVVVLDRRTGKRARLGYTTGLWDSCGSSLTVLGLGGSRAAWAALWNFGNNPPGRAQTAAIGGKPAVLDDDLGLEDWSAGAFPTSASGDGASLVYAIVVGEFCSSPGCRLRPWGGSIWRVVGDRRVRIPGTPPASLVSVAKDRLLSVTANRAKVDIRDVASGARRIQLTPRGRVFWAALSPSLAVILIRDGRGKRIEIYDPATGRLRRSVPVSDRALEVAVSATRVVYLAPNGVYALRASGTRDPVLARPRGRAYSLSYEGNRVVWAEWSEDHGARIRELRVDGG